MEWFVVIALLAIPGVWFAAMVVWGLTGTRARKGVGGGGGPFWKQVALEPGETLRSQLGAVHRAGRYAAYFGVLYFTDRRLIFTPTRNFGAPSTHWVLYSWIVDWKVEKRRQLGIGAVVPQKAPALTIRTSAREYVYWPALGYEITKKAEEALSNARSEAASPKPDILGP